MAQCHITHGVFQIEQHTWQFAESARADACSAPPSCQYLNRTKPQPQALAAFCKELVIMRSAAAHHSYGSLLYCHRSSQRCVWQQASGRCLPASPQRCHLPKAGTGWGTCLAQHLRLERYLQCRTPVPMVSLWSFSSMGRSQPKC